MGLYGGSSGRGWLTADAASDAAAVRVDALASEQAIPLLTTELRLVFFLFSHV